MESLNSFKKGMNKDINPLNQPKDTYKDALNIRLVNDADSTTLSANNIKGNVFSTTIPDSPTIKRIDIIAESAGNQLTIAGQTGTAFDTTGWDGQDLYNYIVNDAAYTLCAQNVGASSPTYNIYYDGNHIVIVEITPTAGGAITLANAAGTGLPPTTTINSTYVPYQTNLEVIGSVTIRDEIYLYTTNNTTKNPGGHSNNSSLVVNGPSVGQIWKMTYDKVSLAVPTLELIYSNYIDFSTYYAIPPSATLGRYENSQTKRIYWTDNFNKLRSLNVANPQVLALDPTILNITPAVDFDIPLLQSLKASSGNNLTAGVIQCAYRLKNTGGAVTTFSALSNIVSLVQANEATSSFVGYYGNTQTTAISKVIEWKINNIDRDFDRIEVAIIFRDSITGTPVIEILDDAPITGDDYTVIYDGTQNSVEITLNEFTALAGAFTHCKTIETKDNRLFAANIRNQQDDINYDARVYRFDAANTFDIVENGTTNAYNNSSWSSTGTYPIVGWDTIDQESDAINPSTLPSTDPNYATGFIYKDDGTTLGGTGPNISYEFYTVAIAADRDTTGGASDFGVADSSPAPWRAVNPRYFGNANINLNVYSPTNQGGTLLQEYPPAYPNINDGFKYPHISGLLRGYQRNEIYRFGIQFFDKSKNPYFVKWIGDIKMPDYNDTNGNSYYEDGSATSITDFRPSFVANKNGSYKEAFVQSLGIKFDVYIPDDLIDLISGYQIVRVEREEKDKTIVCEGYLNKTSYGSDGNYYMTSLYDSSGGNTGFGTTTLDNGYFVTPDLNDPNLTVPTAGMTLKLKGIMTVANSDTTVDFSGGAGNPYYMWKLYGWSTISNSSGPFTIDQITFLNYAGQTTDTATSKTVFNYDFDTSVPDITTGFSMGNACYYYDLDADIDYTDVNSTGNRFLVSIERELTNQYGGSTYSLRASNVYMSCSIFKPVRKSQVGVPDSPIVFGGDTFVNMYDSCRWAKNWGTTGRGTAASGDKYSSTIFFPCSSKINTELRYGTYMNKDMALPYDNPGAEFVETYNSNPVYSAENNVKTFFPKPDPYIANEEFDNRIHASEIKINGELIDSWGSFLTNNYWDVEGSYGGINAVTALKDKFYFWQDNAFGTMSINPRVMVTDTGTDQQIQLGTGNVLQRHDYVSIEDGLQHQWGMTKSADKLYWVDIDKKKFFSYGGQGLLSDSDVKGMLSWFNSNLKNLINTTDKPVYNDITAGVSGIRAVYHDKYEQAIFTFTDGSNEVALRKSFTLVYDNMINSFSSFFSHIPKVYITDGNKFFSTDPSNLSDIYMHDEGDYGVFYTVAYPSTIKLVVNDHYDKTKVFDNVMYDSQSLQYNSTYDNYQNDFLDTWESIRVYNDHQNTDFQTIALNAGLKRKERTWQLQIPRNRVLYTSNPAPNIFDPTELSSPNNKTFGERLRDKYIIVDLLYNNNNNRLLTCNNFRVSYRPSAR